MLVNIDSLRAAAAVVVVTSFNFSSSFQSTRPGSCARDENSSSAVNDGLKVISLSAGDVARATATG